MLTPKFNSYIYDIDDGARRPRRVEQPIMRSLGDFGSDTDAAFRRGRELFKEGRQPSYLKALGKNKTNAWRDALHKGYEWQRARAKPKPPAPTPTVAPSTYKPAAKEEEFVPLIVPHD